MPNTIDIEARRNLALATDVDKHRRRILKQDGNVSVQFVGPVINTFERYRFFLLKNSVTKELKEEFKFRPDYLSYDEYGTVTLWPLILFINDVASLEEFDLDNIIVPSIESILQISRFNELNIDPIDLDAQAQTPSIEEDIVLYTNKIAPNLVDQSSVSTQLTQQPEDPVFYIRRKITLTEVDILNKYIDLGLTPIIESLDMKIKDNTLTTIYGEHYTIVERPNGELRRLSWSDADNAEGPGLETELVAGSVLEVKYVQDENA